MEYKSFKEFYWKNIIWRVGLPWGLLTGVLFSIIRNKEVLSFFLSWETILTILLFMLGGCLYAITVGKSFWKRTKGKT